RRHGAEAPRRRQDREGAVDGRQADDRHARPEGELGGGRGADSGTVAKSAPPPLSLPGPGRSNPAHRQLRRPPNRPNRDFVRRTRAVRAAPAWGRGMGRISPFVVLLPLGLLAAVGGARSVPPDQPAKDAEWARVTEDGRAIKVETDKLEAVIPKKDPRQW